MYNKAKCNLRIVYKLNGERIMEKIIRTVYENGVFKPLQKIDIKENEKIEIKIISSSLKASDDPVLAELWDNEKDAAYDRL